MDKVRNIQTCNIQHWIHYTMYTQATITTIFFHLANAKFLWHDYNQLMWVETKQPVTRIHELTEKGNCSPPQRPPASAAPVHLHPHCQEVAQEIPSHARHHSAEEIRPRSNAAASEQRGAASSVWLASSVKRSHKAQQTTCQPCNISYVRPSQNLQTVVRHWWRRWHTKYLDA